MPELIVVGSLNMDLVVQTSRFPAPGETIQGGDLTTFPGGKGANQAVAASKQDVEVAMVGKVGDDSFGQELLASMADQGVETSGIQAQGQTATGTALILVNQEGENMIVLSPGANAHLQPGDIDHQAHLFDGANMLLTQFEIPFETVKHALNTAREQKLEIIVNPAPGRKIPTELLHQIDILVPNESELSLISGMEVTDLSTASEAARILLQRGLTAVVVTLGKQGALLITPSQEIHFPAHEVQVVDTTAAGDAFIGGLASALHHGHPLAEAVDLANSAGALATTKSGAQPSLPSVSEVQALYQSGCLD